MKNKPKHPGRTAAQRRVLDEIGCGNYSPVMAKSTRDSLLREGKIVQLPNKTMRDFLGTISIQQFEMPTNIHMQWCSAVEDEIPDDEVE